MEVTLDKYGRIVVPKSVRDQLGIQAGTDLAVEVKEGRLVLSPVPERASLEERDGLLVSTVEVSSDADVQSIIDDVRSDRAHTIAGRSDTDRDSVE
jgi:AbrB family looped-hinge helix DNA binding protein